MTREDAGTAEPRGIAGADPAGVITALATLRRRCPWSGAQDHESLVKYLHEETAELVEALADYRTSPQSANRDAVIDELGDVFYQVVFHAALLDESAAGTASTDVPEADDTHATGAARTAEGDRTEVAYGSTLGLIMDRLEAKLIRRNPLTFGSVDPPSIEAVEAEYRRIKAQEKSQAMSRRERIDIEGTFNFRDVGGVGGVRTGRVFRADGLAGLSDRGRAGLRGLSITSVVDLRDIGERTTRPDALAGLDLDYLELPIFSDRFFPVGRDIADPGPIPALGPRTASADPGRVAPADVRAASPTPGEVSLESIYRLMLTQHGPRLAQAIEAVAARAEGGVVFHCSAGKDRTGMVAAFALELLGVDREAVLDDYAATEEYLSGGFFDALTRRKASAGVSGVDRRIAIASPRELMETMLGELDERYGADAIEKYLLDQGMTPDTPTQLRRALLV